MADLGESLKDLLFLWRLCGDGVKGLLYLRLLLSLLLVVLVEVVLLILLLVLFHSSTTVSQGVGSCLFIFRKYSPNMVLAGGVH